MRRAVRWLFVWLVVVMAATSIQVAVAGCAPSARQTQAVTASAIAVVVNTSVDALLVEAESREMAIVRDAQDRDTAEAGLTADRARWAPVWAAVDALAVAHDQWATALETGGTIDPQATEEAFCDLRRVAREFLEIPDPLGLCGGGP